jgi:hypothetical protein
VIGCRLSQPRLSVSVISAKAMSFGPSLRQHAVCSCSRPPQCQSSVHAWKADDISLERCIPEEWSIGEPIRFLLQNNTARFVAQRLFSTEQQYGWRHCQQ